MDFKLKSGKGTYYENLNTISSIKKLIELSEIGFKNFLNFPENLNSLSKEDSKNIIFNYIEENKDTEKTEIFDDILYYWATEIGHSELIKPHISTPKNLIMWGIYIGNFDEMITKAINIIGILEVGKMFKNRFPKKMHLYKKFLKKIIKKIKKIKLDNFCT